ncbi:MAG: SCO family protein [Armatimonadota bacterium]|nr:SCO family protein [Armatimonadota bacterium]MDW8156241.1 SCO family protein [Armatimonadota bacterium]
MASRWLAALVACVVVLAPGCSRREALRTQPLDPPRELPDLVAHDHLGRTFRMADQKGKVVLLFFGYTTCPDVCPATLARWKRVRQELGTDADRVRFVFVTVDPERDTAVKVREYLELFSPEFIGLVGPHSELHPFYEFFGAAFEKVPQPGSAAGYLVAHTAAVPVVDAQGRWRLRFNPETSVDDYVHDLRVLLREAK